jgi:hypothetical protein
MKVAKFIKDIANWCAHNGAYTMVMFAITIFSVLAFCKGVDISSVVPALVGLFLGQTTSRAISSHWAASRDSASNTSQVIMDIEGTTPIAKTTPPVKPPTP